MAELSELGFESFAETGEGLDAYVPVSSFKEEAEEYLTLKIRKLGIKFERETIREQNWNALWESQYEPVIIAGKCMVRAPFHDPLPGILYDILIEPRMSFGTAHHETTALMLEMLLREDLTNYKVLDMGCGTGVLGILASKMGASGVDAIDTDEWAFGNCRDNVGKNNLSNISVIHGDTRNIPETVYNMILANINRNVLLEDLPVYGRHLAESGSLFLSGFYEKDMAAIRNRAEEQGLTLICSESKNNWVGAKFVK